MQLHKVDEKDEIFKILHKKREISPLSSSAGLILQVLYRLSQKALHVVSYSPLTVSSTKKTIRYPPPKNVFA